jgi:hypothetical protein
MVAIYIAPITQVAARFVAVNSKTPRIFMDVFPAKGNNRVGVLAGLTGYNPKDLNKNSYPTFGLDF